MIVFDPVSGKTWHRSPSEVARELRRDRLAPLGELVPRVPQAVAGTVFVRLSADPTAYAATVLAAAQWWHAVGRQRWCAEQLRRQRPRVGTAVPRRAKRQRKVAHGWGRLAPVGVYRQRGPAA